MKRAARTCRPTVALGVGLGLVLAAACSSRAAWGSGALFGEASRTASLADAVTARPGELSAIYYNPGALADLETGLAELSGHLGVLSLTYQRHGEPVQETDRIITGIGLGVGTRLPGPEWLRVFRIGVAAHVPLQYALHMVAPSRPDTPSFPLYGDRAERTAIAGALAVKLFDRIGVGVGVTLTPTLFSPTLATYQPGRGSNANENVVLHIERELQLGAAFVAGVRAQVVDELALGFAYRQESSTSASGSNDVHAGGLVIADEFDFFDFLSPEEFAIGVAVFPLDQLSASLDGVLARWSRYRTIHNEIPVEPLSDVVNLRGSIEWLTPVHGLDVRGGYGYEPSPIPPQEGGTNLLGGDAHTLTIGAGFDFRRRGWLPIRVDAHFRAHLLVEQQADKRIDALSDSDPVQPGHQIDNLGYPGFSAGGDYLGGGLAITFFFGQMPVATPIEPYADGERDPTNPKQPEEEGSDEDELTDEDELADEDDDDDQARDGESSEEDESPESSHRGAAP